MRAHVVLPEEMIEVDGKEMPVTTSRFYTNSLGEKANLRRDLEGWRGRAFTDDELQRFNLTTILGVPCMLTIVGGENGKTKVASVSGLPKRTECPPQINKSFAFWLDEFDETKFAELSDGIRKIVEKSEEFEQMESGESVGYSQNRPEFEEDPNEIPF